MTPYQLAPSPQASSFIQDVTGTAESLDTLLRRSAEVSLPIAAFAQALSDLDKQEGRKREVVLRLTESQIEAMSMLGMQEVHVG